MIETTKKFEESKIYA